MKTIWALFSVHNEYNQPDNNLKAWWIKKPSIQTIANVVNCNPRELYGILSGKEIRMADVAYRLRTISEGEVGER